MSALLRHPATVPSLFARSVEDETAPHRRPGVWHAVLRAAGPANIPAGVAATGAGLIAALIDVPLVQAASRFATTTLAN